MGPMTAAAMAEDLDAAMTESADAR